MYATNGIFGGQNKSHRAVSNKGILTTGELLYNDSSVTLTTKSITKSQANISAPNGYDAHNLTFSFDVTDTTGGTTAPVGTDNIESILQDLVITGSSGKTLALISGVNGEFGKWQHRLNNPTQYYTDAPTPTNSVVATSYTTTWNFTFTDWVIANAEFPLRIKSTYNTLGSRATTLNGLTSVVDSFSITADFVPLNTGNPSFLRTKMISTSTGIVDFGNEIDRDLIFDLSIDVGTDSNLSHTNTFNVAVNNSSLLNNTDYQNIVSKENTIYPIAIPHIDGFFPINALVPTLLDGNQKIKLTANITSLPTIGGNSGVVNMYMLEKYS